MASGRVCTGFSLPYVAAYSVTGGNVSYGTPMKLARGVDVSITPNTGSDVDFYADNQRAESAGGVFTDGTFSVTVDGLKQDAEKMIMGLPAADSDGWLSYGDSLILPYVGFGFIARFMEEGVTTYVPFILAKTTFDFVETSAATQEAEISFQTQALTGKIYRSDDANHNWKHVGKEYETEAAAEAALLAKLA